MCQHDLAVPANPQCQVLYWICYVLKNHSQISNCKIQGNKQRKREKEEWVLSKCQPIWDKDQGKSTNKKAQNNLMMVHWSLSFCPLAMLTTWGKKKRKEFKECS